jgi:hypothetical protein
MMVTTAMAARPFRFGETLVGSVFLSGVITAPLNAQPRAPEAPAV